MQLIFIRHGKTQGNLEGRYVGRTDEPLCAEGRAELSRLPPLSADFLFVSPMRRCRESAEILLPQLEAVVVENFRECDFGAFEMKNHAELDGRADYQAWIDSGGELPFPGGESRAGFQARCCAAFERVVNSLPAERVSGANRAAFVVHGGTIMAILSRFGEPRRGYFDWQVRNGEGFAGALERSDGGIRIHAIERLF